MTQLTVTIEDKTLLPHLKKILKALPGVSVSQTKKRPGIDTAMEEIQNGRTKSFTTLEDLYKDLGI